MNKYLLQGKSEDKYLYHHYARIMHKESYKQFVDNQYLPIFDKKNMTIIY